MTPSIAVIFDVDGVLVDSYQAHFESFRVSLEEMGTHFTEPQFRDTFGRTTRDIVAELHDKKLSDEAIRHFDDRKEAKFREILRREFPAIDGAAELIQSLSEAGFALAVGSSGPPENVQLALDCLGCGNLFSARVTGGDVTHGKPDPQVFLLAAQRLGVPPGQCAVVEDAPAGVEAANRAGMASIGLTGTATREQLSHAQLVVDSLRELSPQPIADLISGVE
jgi:beta-phosphoglucomutase